MVRATWFSSGRRISDAMSAIAMVAPTPISAARVQSTSKVGNSFWAMRISTSAQSTANALSTIVPSRSMTKSRLAAR